MTALLAAALAALACRLVLAPGAGSARRRLHGLTSARPGRERGLVPGSVLPGSVLPGPVLPGPVLLDLVAAVLAAGAPLGTALCVVGDAAARHGDPWTARCLHGVAEQHDLGLELGLDPAADDSPRWVQELGEAAALAREAGIAVGPLLVAAAEQERRRQVAAARVAAARLAVQVVLPTGLCLLPAFVLLAVVPLVLGLLGIG